MSTDGELLRRYVDDRSEAAFAELVRRHLNLVYFAALRQMGGDAHRAKDVAQSVFTDLARKASALTERATLTGWLHTSTRFTATKARRDDFSRQQHEHEATTMNVLLSDSDPAAEWERLRPMIDDVIHSLDDRDREAVLLRYIEGRPFAEIGATLRLSDDAVRMRVDRALEKLRAAFARRGVKSTSAALAAVFANQVGATVPAGLANAITTAALGGVASGAAVTGTVFFMSNTSTAIISAVALVAIGSTFFQWNHAQRAEADLATLAADRDRVRAELHAEQQRATRSAQNITALQSELFALKAKQTASSVMSASVRSPNSAANPALPNVTLGMERWEIQQATLGNLRQIDAARKQYQLENARLAGSIHDLIGRKGFIKTVRSVNGEDYSALSMNPAEPLTVTTPNGLSVTFDPSGANTTRPDFPPEVQRLNELSKRIQPAIKQALDAYRAAHNGGMPADERALVAYFATPQEGADYLEALDAKKAAGL